MATSTRDGDAAALIVSGTERLLDDVQAVEDLERVRALYVALETKESWSWLLDATRGGEGVQIFIGAEDDLFTLTGCSVVVAPYTNSNEQIVGAIGVIGPTRLNYARVIPVVDYTAKVIGRLMGSRPGFPGPEGTLLRTSCCSRSSRLRVSVSVLPTRSSRSALI